jgi:ATPase subunit of ABC transporter with duplicated ATPase domains
MIALRQVTFARVGRPLVIDASVQLHTGWKVGVVGANGCGKSSLFALLSGELHAESGDVELPASWHIARVAQETPALPDSALDFVLDGDVELRRIERELAKPKRATTAKPSATCTLRRNRRLFGQGPRRRSAARPGLHRRRLFAPGGGILRRLAGAPQPGPRPDPAAPTCCCSTSRPTTSTSTR